MSDSLLASNSAIWGGGIYNDPGVTLNVRASTFSGNSANDSGGAIDNAGSATIQESTFSGNSAGSEGGGILDANTGALAIKDSTVLGNFAPIGGDIYVAGLVIVSDSIIGVRYDA